MTAKGQLSISMVSVEVPVKPTGRRRAHDGDNPVVKLELDATACRVWDNATYTDCGESYPYQPGSDQVHALVYGDRRLADMPYFADVFKFVTEQYAANRGNPLGDFLQVVAIAMEASLAETQGSCVYFARAGDRVKIGWSRQVASRLAQLQTGNADPIELLGVLPGARAKERELHQRFAHCRVAGEWFEATPELITYIAVATN